MNTVSFFHHICVVLSQDTECVFFLFASQKLWFYRCPHEEVKIKHNKSNSVLFVH